MIGEGARDILRELEHDAQEAERGRVDCTGCGDPIAGEPADAFWTEDGTFHRLCPACALALATADVNRLDVPEVRHYRREVIEGAVVTTYEQRDSGQRDWRPVHLVRLTDDGPAGAPGGRSADLFEMLFLLALRRGAA